MATLRAPRSGEGEGQHGRETSKRDGTFEIDGLLAGSFDLTVRHDEYRVRTEVVEVPGEELRIALERGFEVSGTVLDAEALPVPGVSVMLREDEGPDRADGGRSDVTDARGQFRLKGIDQGNYVVAAFELPARKLEGLDRTLRMVSAKVTVSGEGTPALELRFKGGEKISGRVVTSEGEPLEGATVHARPDQPRRRPKLGDGEATSLGMAVSGADGSFEMRDLVPGKFLVAATKEGFAAPADSEGWVSANTGDAAVRLVLTSQGKVRGRVVDPEGKPIKHFTVDRQDHHDDKGSFELRIYREGERELVFTADGFASTNRRLTARIGETFDLGDVVLTRGRALSGTVLDATTNEPVPDALVDIGDLTHRERLDSIRISEAAGAVRTGADGSFTLPRIDASRPLVLFAYHPSYRWWAEPLDPANSRVVIKLDRGGTVVGRVLDVEGRPSAHHEVVVKTGTAFKPGSTGEDGTFEIKGLPLGPATVIARPTGEYPIPARETVIPGEGVARVELQEQRGGATLLIRLVGSPGRGPRRPFLVPGTVPMPLNLKELFAATATGLAGKEVPDQESTSEFRNVPPGPATVFVGERGGKIRIFRQVIEVSEEPEQLVEISVPEEFTVIPEGP
jgi:protocatechuate 3,4-dioxygenase beta subunit